MLLAVHDLDARRDLVFGLVGGEAGKRQFPGPAGPAARRAEAFDLAADARSLLVDVVSAAATLPAASEPHVFRFAGRRVTGAARRTGSPIGRRALTRLLEEAAAAGVEQVLVVTATPEAAGPHALGTGARRRPRTAG